MPIKGNATSITDKWARNLGAAQTAITDGVNAVTVNPAEKAIAAADRWFDAIVRAHAEGKYVKGLQRTSLPGWKDAMINVGIQRISQGANKAKPKVRAFWDAFIPHLENGLAQLENTPRGDLATNTQRAVFMIQHNAGFNRG